MQNVCRLAEGNVFVNDELTPSNQKHLIKTLFIYVCNVLHMDLSIMNLPRNTEIMMPGDLGGREHSVQIARQFYF